jgi:WD40 repeat protein
MIESKRLIGHNEIVYCLVFSKKYNWFASGSDDSTIRCWKENADKDWVSTEPGK